MSRSDEVQTALQQHCDVSTVPIQQMRDLELAQAWQDLASILITSVSSWPPSAVDSLERSLGTQACRRKAGRETEAGRRLGQRLRGLG